MIGFSAGLPCMDTAPDTTWTVYILRCGDGSLYTGIARDALKRLAQHSSGKGARYTKGRGPCELVYTEPCGSRSAASKREAAIKSLSRAAKLGLTGLDG